MAAKVTTASEQVYTWLREHYVEHSLGSAREAMEKEVGVKLSKRAMGYRMESLGLQFPKTDDHKLPPQAQKVIDWLTEHCSKHSLETGLQAINNELGFKLSEQAVYMRMRRIGLSWGRQSIRQIVLATKAGRERELEKELRDAIESGALVRQGGIARLLKQLRGKCAEGEEAPTFLATRKDFEAKIAEIVWTREAMGVMRDLVKHGVNAETYHEYHAHIPLAMIRAKMKELTGLTTYAKSATFLRGIGRLGNVKGVRPITLPKTSFVEPYESGVTRKQWAVRVINGANLGVRYNPLIAENMTRIALANARRRSDDCVVLTNIIDLDFRAGGGRHKVLRSLVSGLNTNIQILDPDYRDRAKGIREDPDSTEVVYETAAQLLEEIVSGWHKIAVKEGEPEFSGPILIIFGLKEELVIAGAAAWELRYVTVLRHNEILVETKMVRSALARARRLGSHDDERKLQKQLEKLSKDDSLTRISNITAEDDRKYYERMRAMLMKKIEVAIPHSSVIGQGTTFVKFGDEVVEFLIPGNLRVTDTLLEKFVKKCGSQIKAGKMPKAVVICHPYATGYHETGIQRDAAGKTRSSFACIAPVCLDAEFLREEFREIISNPHPIATLLDQGQFEPGVLRLSNLHDVINADVLPVPYLAKLEKMQEARKLAGGGAIEDPKYIWAFIETDPHFGGQQKIYVTDHETGLRLGMGEAVMMMMRRGGVLTPEKMPIHLFMMNDDPTQGQHFENYKKTDPRKRPIDRVERRQLELDEEIRAKLVRAKLDPDTLDPEQIMEIVGLKTRITVTQLEVRGDAWVQDQMDQVLDRHIQPNLDFFDALLQRVLATGLSMRGRSDFDDVDPGDPHDERDLGFVSYGTGNHLQKSVDGAITEGNSYARSLRDKLQRYPHWAWKDELLKKLVKAPLYSGTNIGWGLLKAPGGYEWGIDARNSPPGSVKWGDPLIGCVHNDEPRGNYSYIFDNRVTIKVYGDKHFRGAIWTPDTKYILGMPGVPTDAYGERGFRPNNTGLTLVGFPADGPDGGPILIRALHDDLIRAYFEKPYAFDWAEFLPNPV